MKFKAIDLQEFRGYKETKIQRFIKEFVNANIPVAEIIIEPNEYRNITSAYSSVKNAINRLKMNNISTRVKHKKLYLINHVLFDKAIEEE